ncbi:bacterial regulatory helix-turn-helix, lysR family protein [Collimonas arenae]|uniref:Bacterial regulatory helix-turn-helix, lysR family protein n=1 Tax=Collimonas arenae TaxID=279058 RepID=A0A127PQ07_9BURK|nr:LysR family transcriptional regulator [Collimonas arenae]AMO99855.1 bacterial regulatory helix-turn-helix, lysR family protein [Collimonas arenae]AMP09754.1 bacterial regulatory helix-turn-helix, lysR family protein [Collimonas arenae]
MYSTTDLQLFIYTADLGSLSNAARQLDLLPATASASLKRLEQQLNTRLFVRSTRSMRLTPEGTLFLEYSRQALALLQEGRALLNADGAVSGHLRLSMPSDVGRNVLLPWLDAFQEKYPQVTLSLQFSDRVIDLFRDPVDVAFRYGPLDDSTLVSQPLAASRRVAVAAPSYLAKHGRPLVPKDLASHNCLLYYLQHGLFNNWRFYAGKTPIDVKVRGDRMTDDAAIARAWAVAGIGIAYKSWLDVRQDVADGRLEIVLEQFVGEETPLSMVYPHRSSMSPSLRALLVFLRERFAALNAAP